MNTDDHPPLSSSTHDDQYYSENECRGHSPGLKEMKPNLMPTLSPEPALPIPQLSPESSPEPDSPTKRKPKPKPKPSVGDAVLIRTMDGNRRPDIHHEAGRKVLGCESESEVESEKGGVEINFGPSLAAMAAGALAQVQLETRPEPERTGAELKLRGEEPPVEAGRLDVQINGTDPMEDVKPTIPSITTTSESHSPDSALKLEKATTEPGELPPIRHNSPQSTYSGNGAGISLPSISESIGDFKNMAKSTSTSTEVTFTQSPSGPVRPTLQFPLMAHGSPPKSPNEIYSARELPSPAGGPNSGNPYYPRRYSTADNAHHYSSASDYTSTTETPSTENSGSTPVIGGIDRMSIDGITNPQVGGFQCTFAGCTAQPFQTQYLLNSHANVHSSNRPHYCSVKDCPRSEGGKGFKRKNEMIRHGLVHDSPGYVCPFCPDREHKYPRPDNLQRHVRVHHTEKDKDDAQLREVLSQRSEGPSRGRRRRGGTS